VALVAVMIATFASGYVVQQSLPDSGLVNLAPEELQVQATKQGIRFSVPRLGLTLTAVGPGWSAMRHPSLLFAAENGTDAFLRLTRQALPPFVRQAKYLELLRKQLEEQGLIHQKTMSLTLNGLPALQMRFSGDNTAAYKGDHWAIAVPRQGFAYVLMLYCKRTHCEELAPALEQSRDSFTLAQKQ